MATKPTRRNPVVKVRKSVDVDNAKRVDDDFVKTLTREERTPCYQEIFKEGTRLGFTPEETMDFLRRGGPCPIRKSHISLFLSTMDDMMAALDFLRGQKAVEDNTVDDLVKWRQAVRERLIDGTVDLREQRREFSASFFVFIKEYNTLVKKRGKDIDWYNKVSKALAGKIRGMKSWEKFESESLDMGGVS